MVREWFLFKMDSTKGLLTSGQFFLSGRGLNRAPPPFLVSPLSPPIPVAQVLSVQFLLTIPSYFIIRKIFVRTEFGACWVGEGRRVN